MSKQNINYASSLAVHPLIAEHPLYKSILRSDMNKYSFVENDFSMPLSIIPTYYKYLRNVPHCIIIEDYITLFFPHMHNGSNHNFDYKTFELMPAYKHAFEEDNFRGIICHMNQTLESIKKIFDSEKINKKLYYLPLAYESNIENIKPTNQERIVLTFTNSFGGEKNNFPLRGGLETLMVYKKLYESGYKNIFLNLIGALNIEEDLLNWFTNCENVTIYNSNTVVHGRPMVTDDVVHNALLDTDIFLIPACRIHSMSVVRALCYGNIVIGSNGWGFNEFLNKEQCCEGQEKASYLEDGVLKEKYSIQLEQPNLKLLKSLESKILTLIKNPVQMDKIKKENLQSSKENFSKTRRDIILEKILEDMI